MRRISFQNEETVPPTSRSVRQTWPDSVALREAIQNPKANIGDAALANMDVSLNRQGLPITYTGKFAAVFRLIAHNGETWALRCFTMPPDTGEMRGMRYQLIAHYLSRFDDLFMPYRYIERGIKVGNLWYPAVAMRWSDGVPLGRWVEKNLQNPENLRNLCGILSDALLRLEAAGVAHGDWQHDNLLIGDNGQSVTFVDYDGLFVPELQGMPAPEYGHANYQHPERTAEDFAVGLDRFACLVIQTALLALSHQPGLWARFSDGDSLLFRQTDLRDPERSPLFQTLRALVEITDDEIFAETLARLEDACRTGPLRVLPPAILPIAPKSNGRYTSGWNDISQTSTEAIPTTGKWWQNGEAAKTETETVQSANGTTGGKMVRKKRPEWMNGMATPKPRTAVHAVANDRFIFHEKLTASEKAGEELRHVWTARLAYIALLFLISAGLFLIVRGSAYGIIFIYLQIFRLFDMIYRRWPRKKILDELDGEIAKLQKAVDQRQSRLATPTHNYHQTVDEFIADELAKVPVYHVLNIPGVNVSVMNRLNDEGIKTAQQLYERTTVYGLSAAEMSVLRLWCRNLEIEAATRFKQQHPSMVLQTTGSTDTVRLEQEIAEFEREIERLKRERELFPHVTPRAYVRRLVGAR